MDDVELLRMEDDGAPPPDVAKAKAAARIGIKPNLLLVDGPADPFNPIKSSTSAEPESWASYSAWRRTKCRPFDREALMQTGEDADQARILEEIDQATHEFVGELAEIGELLAENTVYPFASTPSRAMLIDECGDAIFCGVWAIEAWGENPLVARESLELFPPDRKEDNPIVGLGILLGQITPFTPITPPLLRLVEVADPSILAIVMAAQTGAGLTANAFKKLRFQRREQDRVLQVARILAALEAVNKLLVIARSSIAEAMAANRRKLDARFPSGYHNGVGGGIRTGAGK